MAAVDCMFLVMRGRSITYIVAAVGVGVRVAENSAGVLLSFAPRGCPES